VDPQLVDCSIGASPAMVIRVDDIPGNIPELLKSRVEMRPEALAWYRRVSEGRWLPSTLEELWQETRRAAACLRALGLSRGERLAILAPTCRDWFVAEMGGLLAGAAVLGIDPQAAPDQAQLILADSGARGLIVDRAERLAHVPAWNQLSFVITLEDTPQTHDGVSIPAWQQILARQSPCRENDLCWPPTDDPAAVIYTAGTTGRPKGIEYSHGQILIACRSIAEAFPQMGAGDTMLCWLPMAHLFQRMLNLVALARDIKLFFVEDPRLIMTCVREVEPSIFVGVPRFYEKLHEGIKAQLSQSAGWKRRLIQIALRTGDAWAQALRQGTSPSWLLRVRHRLLDRLILRKIRQVMGTKLRFLFTGTAPTPVWMLEFFHSLGWLVLEAYALSENTVPMAIDRPDAYRFGSVGKPFSLNELVFASDGEILVRGPGVFRGYTGDPGNMSLFTADGYYRTGDYGRLDEDGFLYLLGRKAELIKTSTGRRIAPVRVESAYAKSAYVDQIVVFGDGHRHLVALIALNVDAVTVALGSAGVSVPPQRELSTSAAVRELMQSELDARGSSLANHERVRSFAILPGPLSVAAGELTPTLKLRRNQIATRHAELIAALFAEAERSVPTPLGADQ
jgi:long-chain acyl-CoA synthetase